jgi:hypothetical protein
MQALSGTSRTSHKSPLPSPRNGNRRGSQPSSRPQRTSPHSPKVGFLGQLTAFQRGWPKAFSGGGHRPKSHKLCCFPLSFPLPCIVLLPSLSLSLSSSPPAPLGMHQQANSPTLFSPPPKSFGFAGPSSTWFRVFFSLPRPISPLHSSLVHLQVSVFFTFPCCWSCRPVLLP